VETAIAIGKETKVAESVFLHVHIENEGAMMEMQGDIPIIIIDQSISKEFYSPNIYTYVHEYCACKCKLKFICQIVSINLLVASRIELE
jgi:hypothetical protein